MPFSASQASAASFASSLLSQGVTAEGLCALISHLDTEPPARGQDLINGFSWSCGAYVHGGVLGVRKFTTEHPDVVKCLTSYMTQVLPEMQYTTLVLMKNLQVPRHRDTNNEVGFMNSLVALSSFKGGQLWLESAGGTTACPDASCPNLGVLRSLEAPVLFDAHVLHATCPWHDGDRVVLAAFTVRRFAHLPASAISLLQDLGFRVPGLSTGDVALDSPPRPLRSNCPVVFELFCGSARVTAALRNLGWSQAQAVDHQCKPNASANILVSDLSTSKGGQLLRFWLTCPYLVGIFMAPPCGTASLARLIPVYDNAGNQLPAPPPLRSDRHPDGYPWLQGLDKVRVSQANVLYDVVADTCTFPFAQPVLLAVENPRNSLLWSTSMWTRAKDVCRFHVDFQNCAYGGARPKWTRLCCNDASFMSLARTCPGDPCIQHHKPWGPSASGGWSTAEEAAYPQGLARAIAKCFASAVEVVPYADPSLHHASDQSFAVGPSGS